MIAWQRTWKGDVRLRLAGVMVCGIAVLCFRHLGAVAPDARHPGAGAFLVALVGFLSACAGSAMAMIGKHLFDRVEVSERWRQRPVERLRLSMPQAGEKS